MKSISMIDPIELHFLFLVEGRATPALLGLDFSSKSRKLSSILVTKVLLRLLELVNSDSPDLPEIWNRMYVR